MLCVCGPHSPPKGCSGTRKGSEEGGEGDQRDGAVSIREAVTETKTPHSRKGTTDEQMKINVYKITTALQ